jgi:DNA transformation protein
MIGMIFNDMIYLTTDAESRKSFASEKCNPFKFTKRSTGEIVSTHWYAIPDRLYDDADELAQWARVALTVASGSETTRRKQEKHARAPARTRSGKKA